MGLPYIRAYAVFWFHEHNVWSDDKLNLYAFWRVEVGDFYSVRQEATLGRTSTPREEW
jgi:hypothetical protein